MPSNLAAVNFLLHENSSTLAGIEPATLGTEGQRQTNHATQPTHYRITVTNILISKNKNEAFTCILKIFHLNRRMQSQHTERLYSCISYVNGNRGIKEHRVLQNSLTITEVSEIFKSHYKAARELLATGLVILNHGQVTRTTSELAPTLLTSTPHQQEDVSASTYLTCIGLFCTAGLQRQ
ncbi:hypothetical protein TNCV_2839961 [Trichonephila clavipes]|uniref:Uncharacterized protein n=1 Tax=Trichonephila clavipes TaxID=2585209 RepID=A0A8X6RL79_TRICX|nr:hypothetical protein TNCV_2839961 [Trichonephila clavipes]